MTIAEARLHLSTMIETIALAFERGDISEDTMLKMIGEEVGLHMTRLRDVVFDPEKTGAGK